MSIPNGKISAAAFEYSSNAFTTNESSLTVFKTNTDSVALIHSKGQSPGQF
jgi:hypothetical protein